jgi:hypothetical protein
METSSAGSWSKAGSGTGKPVNGLMDWSCDVGSVVSEEDAMGESIISVVLIIEVAMGVVVAGILGVQFPSTKDIKMIQMLGNRGKGRDIL